MEGAFNLRNMNNMPAVCAETKKGHGAFTCGLKGNTSNCCSFSEGEVVECTNKGRDDCDTGGDMEDGMNTIIKLGAINTEEQYPYMYGDCCDPQSGAATAPLPPTLAPNCQPHAQASAASLTAASLKKTPSCTVLQAWPTSRRATKTPSFPQVSSSTKFSNRKCVNL